MTTLSLINFLVVVISRNHYFNNIFFSLCASTKNRFFHYLAIRLGELHRSSAIWCVILFVVYVVFKDNILPQSFDLIIEIFIVFLLIVLLFSSLSFIRNRFHGYFEYSHRYISYIILILLLAYYFIIDIISLHFDKGIFYELDFYLILAIVILVIEPWLCLRKIDLIIASVTSRCTVLIRQGEPRIGTFSRFSIKDREFHSFADSMWDLDDGRSMAFFIAKVGDGTENLYRLCKNKLAHNEGKISLRFRRNRTKGFMSLVPSYSKVMLIATGGGIAPVIPVITLLDNTKIELLWITYDPELEFGHEFFSRLKYKCQQKNITLSILSSKLLKDDRSLLTKQCVNLSLKSESEAVFIISNHLITIDLLWSFYKNKIRAYGATLDS